MERAENVVAMKFQEQIAVRVISAVCCICLALSVVVAFCPRYALYHDDGTTARILESIEFATLTLSALNSGFAVLILVMYPHTRSLWLYAATILPVALFVLLPSISST